MKKYILDNGLRVVLEKIPTSRSVSFGIWVKTGSRYEQQHNNGISHLIEHMLFKGTEKYSAKAIAEGFDRIGGDVNAFTSKEYTCYYAKVLDQHLPIAMDILSDIYFNALMAKDDLVKEKNVIYEEIAMYEDTPDDIVHDLIAKAAYGEHALGYPILGTKYNLSLIQSADLHTYIEDNYHVNNTVISIVGNIDDHVIELIEHYFGSFSNKKEESVIIEPQFLGGQIFHHKKTEQNHFCLSLPGYSLRNELHYAMILLNNVIGGGMSSRLFQEIREERGLAYSIYSYHTAHADSGLFTIYGGTTPNQTNEVLKVTMDVMEDFISKGISETELKDGKEQLKGSLILGLESTSSRMNRLGRNELMLGKHDTLDDIITRIDAVQLKDIEKVITEMFAHPFALTLVGQSDNVLMNFRSDQLATNNSPN